MDKKTNQKNTLFKVVLLFLSTAVVTNVYAMMDNPLLQKFDDILFIERGIKGKGDLGGSHQCTNYFGLTQKMGGKLYLIKNFKSNNPQLVDVLENSVVKNGRLKGKKLEGGAFLSPELSYDGKTILFSYVEPNSAPIQLKGKTDQSHLWKKENCFHIFKVNIDGTNLVQLTDGPYNDFDPVWLPNGRIVFVSERVDTRRKDGGQMFSRCFSHYVPQNTLHSMKADGTDIIPISYHETSEWQPSVNNDGMLVYSRWDYIDRDAAIAQHMWICYPDGRDPRAPHGNYPLPFSTMEGSGFSAGYFNAKRPFANWNIRAIPESNKYIAIGGPHHGQPYGAVILIDVNVEDDGLGSQVEKITKEIEYPETVRSGKTDYGTPWPLSEELYLANYKKSIILLNRKGERHTILGPAQSYNPKPGMRPIDPIPVMVRKKPHAIPTGTYQGERLSKDAPNATISIMNVRISDLPIPKDVKIKELRIMQYFPKAHFALDIPRIGHAGQSAARMSLGTVPVEEDGSVYFKAPVKKTISFQLLDEKGMAVQLMRSATYVHPGEQMSCTGCHENKWESIQVNKNPMALRRPPSDITPEPGALEPINFHRLVKPVFQENCVECHKERKKGPDFSYKSLKPYTFYSSGGEPYWRTLHRPKMGGSRSVPMKHGARGSRLVKGGHLDGTHPQCKPNLSKEDLRKITLWLDANSNELGAYFEQEKQKKGELVWPKFDVDLNNLQGIEKRRATPSKMRDYTASNSNMKAISFSVSQNNGRLDLKLLKKGNYQIQVKTISGKVEVLENIKNDHSWSVNTSKFKNGAYVIQVQRGSDIATEMFLIH